MRRPESGLVMNLRRKIILSNFFKKFNNLPISDNPITDLSLCSRPKVAYISPLLPQRCGISDYSSELLPVLSKYYRIVAVVDQKYVSDPWVQVNIPVRNVKWFRNNFRLFDRVIYHIGNSSFHRHMVPLIKEVPGIVVLHDFFLGHLRTYLQYKRIIRNDWINALYKSHGYKALHYFYNSESLRDVRMKYPVNKDILDHSLGVIVHSEYSKKLAEKWLGKDVAHQWKIISHLRVPVIDFDCDSIRKSLGFKEQDFIVCSFGEMCSSKLNYNLIKSWQTSKLAKDPSCKLIFVGKKAYGKYGAQIKKITDSSANIIFSGWVNKDMFRKYLTVTDLAVQLRMNSRGESSGTVLDCMNYGIPTIVNANGSFSELPSDAVWMLPDTFEDNQLIHALETLWTNHKSRSLYGTRAKEVISTLHSPSACAEKYYNAIEESYFKSSAKGFSTLNNIHSANSKHCVLKQILLDVSATHRKKIITGIERVAISIVLSLIESPPEGYRAEPVYLTNKGGKWHYRYARHFSLKILNCPTAALPDEIVEYGCGDIIIGLDIAYQMHTQAKEENLYTHLRRNGVKVYFMVHDLLPIAMPQYFPSGTDQLHAKWLQAILSFDGVISVSKTVAVEFSEWIKNNNLEIEDSFKLAWYHHGANHDCDRRCSKLPFGAKRILTKIKTLPVFTTVSTIEPRKGHLQIIEAFNQLWDKGIKINLVIVGREGWKGIKNQERRTISKITKAIRTHPLKGKHLFWIDNADDNYLEMLYCISNCLIFASEGEGFGLPLIEAARNKLPIIARDIPIFKEVAGEHAYYFPNDNSPEILSEYIQSWLELYNSNRHPKSGKMTWLRWKESAKMLLGTIINE